MKTMKTGYVHRKKNMVLLRHNGLACWEVYCITGKGKVHKAVAPAISFETHKADALTDMRRKGRTDVPASGWEHARVDVGACMLWFEVVCAFWSLTKTKAG